MPGSIDQKRLDYPTQGEPEITDPKEPRSPKGATWSLWHTGEPYGQSNDGDRRPPQRSLTEARGKAKRCVDETMAPGRARPLSHWHSVEAGPALA